MTIWLLALILLASLAGLGYRQGGIRVACSFLGILFGALLAGPLGRLLKPLLVAMGLKDPLAWMLAPVVVFILISIIFKVAALFVHQKVEVYYKYKAGDLRLALWERLNSRVGLCLGLLNGAAYLILLAIVIYPLAYWTVQVATSDTDSKLVRIVNQLGRDLDRTSFSKVARARDPMSKPYYDAADMVGLVYQNSLLEARLQRYPAFLDLAERPELQDIANDKDFIEMRQRQEPIAAVLNHPKMQAIVKNPELLKLIWATVVPDLADLRTYLETGKSPKYSPERILGRWKFNVNAAMGLVRRAKPNISSTEMQKAKRNMIVAYSRANFVAMTDRRGIFRNTPIPKVAGGQSTPCQWQSLDGGKYSLSIAGAELPAMIENDRLTIGAEGVELVFDRED